MAGNGALDLSIRIMGKVDPSLARSISQVKGLTGSLTDGLKSTNSLAGTVAKTLGVVGKTGLALGATLTGSVLVGVKQVTNEAAKLEAQMAPVMRYVDGLADASGKASNAMAQNGKTFAQNYADMKNYIQDLSTEIPRTTEQITTMSAALGQSGKDVTEQLQAVFCVIRLLPPPPWIWMTRLLATTWQSGRLLSPRETLRATRPTIAMMMLCA